MKKFLDGFSKIIEVICVIVMCLMVLVVFFATVGRYSKLYALPWSDEFARYGMITIVYLGLMLASRQGGHFVVEIVPMIFPKPVVKAISVLVALLVDAFAVFLVKYGWAVSSKMLNQGKTSPMLEIPLGAMYLLIPIGIVLMAIFYTIHTFEGLKDPKPEEVSENGCRSTVWHSFYSPVSRCAHRHLPGHCRCAHHGAHRQHAISGRCADAHVHPA